MRSAQLDIFGSDETEASASEPLKPKRRRSRKPRKVKKAQMLVDSYDAKVSSAVPQPPLEEIVVSEVKIEAKDSGPRIYSVSDITENIKGLLENSYNDIWVTGEVTDFKNRGGPHFYFALKDERSKIRAVIFGAGSKRLPFDLADGLELVCHGRLNVYAPRGEYSIVIDHLEPKGIGALQLAFEQLKGRLEAEGLFDKARKKPIPFLPKRIGVITSPTGAAIRDIIHVLTRRFPNIEVLLYPVRVQGEGAASEIALAIETMNGRDDLDVLIVGRGGGSIEDLWAFNEEVVARAIAASRIPIISAVGHEIDFTIADFVADVRAPTPSAAAEIAVPVRSELIQTIVERRRHLALSLKRWLEKHVKELSRLAGLMRDPRMRLPDFIRSVDSLRERLVFAMRTAMDRRVQMLAKFASNMEHLSPLGILAKGYAVAEDAGGNVVTSSKSLKVGDILNLRFHEGGAHTKVTKIRGRDT